jgi:hypothetical protein
MDQILILLIGCLLSVIGTILAFQFKGMRQDLHEITKSVQMLNEKLASVLTDQEWQKERLSILEKRIEKLVN